MKKVLMPLAAAITAATLLTACGQSNVKENMDTAATEVASMNNNDLYEVHEDGRIYVFDDRATYESFLEVGETSYRKVRIGAGPKGETVVFGLTDADKKKMEGIASVDMFDGKLAGSDDFYGEMRAEGRIYVFGSLEEMAAARVVGEVPLRYTDIGSGPNGETVVYALNNDNKKVKPEAMIAKFKAMNGL
ncbi:hypothetical protein FJM67_14200 [Maribrevibacterium harenarium]|uniref:Lipoprotein n=1 Tax=Maribrevibacterium harenarium TaxID=2589817 RepID=A0A501WL22_9GAMM|nr:hypothetical protein [Maribrevibacterium harenarium]TPE47751.1 hypothetical protein FJM67_14200 [Maribrevibacterium harenarium]